jgi:hypothetical protein
MDGSVSRRGASDTTKFAETPLWNVTAIPMTLKRTRVGVAF